GDHRPNQALEPLGAAKTRDDAQELVYSGRIIKADEALRIGLVARVTAPDTLLEAAQETALTIASKGPVAIAHAKAVIRDGASMPLTQANDLEAKAFATCFATDDRAEGMQAFLDKRDAQFKGR
ncbi:MAG: enoyl-CoA hydratase-related protein, partial [Myxococcota bacterium]